MNSVEAEIAVKLHLCVLVLYRSMCISIVVKNIMDMSCICCV